MIMTLALVIAMVAVMTGSFLSLGQQQLTTQRTIDRIRLYWAAEAVIDYTFAKFSDFVETNAQYPDYDADTLEVRNSMPGQTEGPLFTSEIAAWFSGLADDFKWPFPSVIVQLDQSALSVRQIKSSSSMSNPTDAYREYEIRVMLTNPNTGSASFFSQVVRVSAGKLFDYSTFYNTDLEIASGTDYDLQGPVFSNANIYLMTGPSSQLRLSLPSNIGEDPENYYALRSAGHIYFYFKRFLARNYFLDKKDGRYRNEAYVNGAPDYLRTDDAERMSRYGGIDGLDSMELEPYAFRTREKAMPMFYYPRNEIRFSSFLYDEPHIVLQIPGKDDIPLKFLSHHYFLNQYPLWPPDAAASYYLDAGNYGKAGDFMNATPVYDPVGLQPPKRLAGWTAADPKSENPGEGSQKEVLNNRWGAPASDPTGMYVADTVEGVTSRAIPVGDPNAPNGIHTLIDPLVEGEKVEVRKQKLASMADLRLSCTTDTEPIAATDRAGSAIAAGAFASIGMLYDYRMGGEFPTVTIDVANLNTVLSGFECDTSGTGCLVYVGVPEGPYEASGENKVALVRLTNGGKLLSKGLTVVTNGRLWIQGDYNTYEYPNGTRSGGTCSAGDWDQRACVFPPAAVFSDSFGILSNSWKDSYGGATSLDKRPVAGSSMVNTAVVTGFVPSQLEETFPRCDADHPEECFQWARRSFVKDLPPDASGWYSQTGASHVPAVSGARCPAGLDASGNPVDWSDCELRKDTATGIFYVPTLMLFKRIYNTAWKEYDGTYYNTNGVRGLSAPEKEQSYTAQKDRWGAGSPWGLAWSSPDDSAPPLPDPDGTALQKLLHNIIVTRTVTRWDQLTPDEKEILRGFRVAYTIPVARKNDANEWSLVCCDKKNTDGRCDFSTNRICHPADTGFSSAAVSYRNVVFSGNVLPDRDIPVNTDSMMRCPGRDWEWRTYQPVPPECEVRGVPLTGGVYFNVIMPDWLTGPSLNYISTTPDYVCKNICTGGSETEAPVCTYTCTGGAGPSLRYEPSGIRYYHGRYVPLYVARYSGGLENLINYQEQWGKISLVNEKEVVDWQQTIRFYGVQTAPWHARELRISTTVFPEDTSETVRPAFWKPAYYCAPARKAFYNETLRTSPPPGTPSVYALTRKTFRELDPRSGEPLGIRDESAV